MERASIGTKGIDVEKAFAAITTGDEAARARAVRGIAGDPSFHAIVLIARALSDESPRVRAVALKVLARREGHGAEEALRVSLASPNAPQFVREAAETELRRLKAGGQVLPQQPLRGIEQKAAARARL